MRFVDGSVSVALSLAILSATALAAPPTAHPSLPLIESGPPGWLLVTARPYSLWSRDALDLFALRYGKILLRCGGNLEELRPASAREPYPNPLRIPDNPDGMRQIASQFGARIVDVTPEVVMMQFQTANPDACLDAPLLLVAQQAPTLGIPLDENLDLHAVEVGLFQEIGHRVVLGGVALVGAASVISYWASREGRGRELYALPFSSDDGRPGESPSRSLAKVAVEGIGRDLTVRPLWSTSCDGPVAALELDFDGDGITDLVCLTGIPGSVSGTAPLVVLSGATGKRIGEFDGQQEIIITQVPTGCRVRTSGSFYDHEHRTYMQIRRTYSTKGGAIVLDTEQRVAADAPMVCPQLNAGAHVFPSPSSYADELVLAHVVVEPYYSEYGPLRGIAPLGRVGDELERTALNLVLPPTAHVLLNHRPGRVDKAAVPSR